MVKLMKILRLLIYATLSFNWISIYPISAQFYPVPNKSTIGVSTHSRLEKNTTLLKNLSMVTVNMQFIDPGVTAYGGYRWRDVAGNLFSVSYIDNYQYDLPTVEVQLSYYETTSSFSGTLVATNLKPNFAYQMKLVGIPETGSNELIGFTGRWWQEEWNNIDEEWTNGQNLNNKGNGYFPNPNDLDYISRKDIPDPNSPTGKKYRYTGYLPFDFFVTDGEGSAVVQFEQNSSFHVFWNTLQNYYINNYDPAQDGPLHTVTFDPDPSQAGSAYSTDYSEATMSLFGEWERLPMGEIYLPEGDYTCQFILTEESFHSWPGGSYTGNWASVMGTEVEFTIMEDYSLPVQLSLFQAKIKDSTVIIEWTTACELNNAGFEIYKSIDKGMVYHVLSSYKTNPALVGHGNSTYAHNYSFKDKFGIDNVIYFYKLAQVDFSGEKTFFGPISVTTPLLIGEFKLEQNYPNPFNASTTIKFNIPHAGFVSLKIYDSLGKELETLVSDRIEAGIYFYDWKANNLVSGIYFIYLKYDDVIRTQKALLIK
jgi:hypothetical protein